MAPVDRLMFLPLSIASHVPPATKLVRGERSIASGKTELLARDDILPNFRAFKVLRLLAFPPLESGMLCSLRVQKFSRTLRQDHSSVLRSSSNESSIGVRGELEVVADAGADNCGDAVLDLSCSAHSWILVAGPPTIVTVC